MDLRGSGSLPDATVAIISLESDRKRPRGEEGRSASVIVKDDIRSTDRAMTIGAQSILRGLGNVHRPSAGVVAHSSCKSPRFLRDGNS